MLPSFCKWRPCHSFFHGTNVFFISKQWSNYKHEIALRNIYCGSHS
ncbi:hypothetical protein NC652_024945 [Populus alba x Populus x berolinensis]|uniref:Uncharacterized protein n=1 Tax=Populus alba x Populus x berolinensis TaxID=444605 RepID=A0AAD6M9T3_9ROSI|nr:hypothetical protein NC651_023862 [Populus alba x Populus x berolinensis]KAJ6898280.1 hypothetical protein NC652_024945 [Populus alba x Populus x berolinensis]KAJ6981271.1 hypothetical protein NC653_024621 [Populus alba x Populus x berolinensis]